MGGSLHLRSGLECAALDLRGAYIRSHMYVAGLKILGSLNLEGVYQNWRQPVMLVEIWIAVKFKLARACVHELVAFLGSQLKANLHMEQASVEGLLLFGQGAQMEAVVLPQAKVGGGLTILDTTVHGPLNMESIEVGKSLKLYEGNQFGTVNLRAAKVQEALAIIGSTFWGSLDMEAIQVQGSVFMGEGTQFTQVNFEAAKGKTEPSIEYFPFPIPL